MTNLGTLDHFIRLIVGEFLLAFTVAGWLPAWCSLGALLIVSAVLGFDPIYTALGANTAQGEAHG